MKKSPDDSGEIFSKTNWLGDCLGHFCGHWAIFSHKHLVTLTLGGSVDTFNQKTLSLKVFFLKD
jgi:hypothetical protein